MAEGFGAEQTLKNHPHPVRRPAQAVPVLLTIAGLSFVTAYPALLWLTGAPSFGKILAVG